MKIFLTGATGFLGSHFLNEIFSQQLPIQVVAHKRSINSIPRVELSLEPEWLVKPLDVTKE